MFTDINLFLAMTLGLLAWAAHQNASSQGVRTRRTEETGAENGPEGDSARAAAGQVTLAWPCLSVFALFEAAGCCLKAFGAEPWLSGRVIGTSLGLMAGLTLVEFARRGQNVLGTRSCRPWIHAPLVALAAIGLFWGECRAIDATSRYALILPGGLWAAWLLWRAARRIGFGIREMRVAAACLVLFTLSLGVVVPAAGLAPAVRINEAAFRTAVGWPIQAVQAFAALALALSLWRHATHRAAAPAPSRWPWAAAGLLALAVVWAAFHSPQAEIDALMAGGAGPAAATGGALDAAAQERADWSRLTTERWRAGVPIVLGMVILLAAMVVAGMLANERPRSRSKARPSG